MIRRKFTPNKKCDVNIVTISVDIWSYRIEKEIVEFLNSPVIQSGINGISIEVNLSSEDEGDEYLIQKRLVNKVRKAYGFKRGDNNKRILIIDRTISYDEESSHSNIRHNSSNSSYILVKPDDIYIL